MKKLLFVLSVLSLFITSCKKEGCTDDRAENYNSSAKDDDGSCTFENEYPWENGITHGNSAINSKDIVTNEDGSSGTYYIDYVYTSELPDSDFEFYSIHIYIPINDDLYYTNFTNYGGTISYSNEEMAIAGNDQSGFIGKTEIDGVSYSVYEIVIRDTDLLVNKVNFKNILWSFDLTYNSIDTDEEVYSNDYKVEVYKRD